MLHSGALNRLLAPAERGCNLSRPAEARPEVSLSNSQRIKGGAAGAPKKEF
jgi:hypothetical protein